MKFYNNRPFIYKTLMIVLVFQMFSCHTVFHEKWTKEKAPEYFKATFETTKGNFEIEANRVWSPHGVDRLYQLINKGFYTDIAIFRVIPDFVAQFGIHNDSIKTNAWNKFKVPDEPVIESNLKATIAFARSTPGTRTNQIFINLKDNIRLDTLNYSQVKGFPVVAKVIKGMDVVEAFFNGYSDELDTKQDSIHTLGNAYLKKNYPKLDYIIKAYITDKKKN